MYRCEMCEIVVEASKPAIKRVVKTRQRDYPARQTANREGAKPQGRSRRKSGDPGGSGQEIVHEIIVCADCAKGLPQQENSDI